MYWNDMREFLDYLRERGDLVDVNKAVSTEFEVAAYIRKSSDTGGPCFLFNEVTGHNGWRVVGSMYSDRRRILAALGVGVEQATTRYLDAIRNPIPWEVVDGGPCKDVVLTGDDVDLAAVPVVRHSEKDGVYITAGVEVVRDPDTGVHGLGMHRMEVFGRNRLGLWAPGERRIGRARVKQEERGQRTEIAVVISPDPSTVLGSCARVPTTRRSTRSPARCSASR